MRMLYNSIIACLVMCHAFYHLLIFFNFSGISSECKTVWNRIRPDILPSLIWVQTVCISYLLYQQMTLAGSHLVGEERACWFTWFFFLVPSAMGVSAVCDCGISLSYPIFLKNN